MWPLSQRKLAEARTRDAAGLRLFLFISFFLSRARRVIKSNKIYGDKVRVIDIRSVIYHSGRLHLRP